MDKYELEARLDRIERMLRFIIDNTIASGILEELKKDDMAEDCRDSLTTTYEVLADESAVFMGEYLDGYFETDEDEEV